MSVVLSRNWENNFASRRGVAAGRSFASKRSRARAASAGTGSLSGIVFVMAFGLIFSGASYLYQVNNISIKGYEVKAIEKRIQELEKENQKLKIREVESRSMYNIEKNTENLNLVNSVNVTYVEMKGPMAMK